MQMLTALLFIAGIVCFLYYVLILSYAGIQAAFSTFWVVSSIAFFLLSFILRYMRRNHISLPKPLNYLILGVLSVGLVIFVISESVIIYSANQKPSPKADYLIVLGAQVKGRRITKSLQMRLDAATEYLNNNSMTKVIVSGGQGPGEEVTEAYAMQQYLIHRGIDEARILLEDQSTNTNENIKFSKAMILEPDAKIVIVTNAFHIYRALGIAKKNGIEQVEGLSATTDRILAVNLYVREAFAVVKDKMIGNMN